MGYYDRFFTIVVYLVSIVVVLIDDGAYDDGAYDDGAYDDGVCACGVYPCDACLYSPYLCDGLHSQMPHCLLWVGLQVMQGYSVRLQLQLLT